MAQYAARRTIGMSSRRRRRVAFCDYVPMDVRAMAKVRVLYNSFVIRSQY